MRSVDVLVPKMPDQWPSACPQTSFAVPTWARQRGTWAVTISEALIGEAVALEETDTGDFLVRFYTTPLGIIARGRQKLARLGGGVGLPIAACRDGQADTATQATDAIKP